MSLGTDLLRQARSAVEAERPACPSCGQRAPQIRGDEPKGSEFFRAHGHRCPHGEPCAGWAKSLSAFLESCPQCSPPDPGPSRLTGPRTTPPAPPAETGESGSDPKGGPASSGARTQARRGERAPTTTAKGGTMNATWNETSSSSSSSTRASRLCAECGAFIEATSPRHKFCSKTCSKRQSNRKFNARRGPKKPATEHCAVGTSPRRRTRATKESAPKAAVGRKLPGVVEPVRPDGLRRGLEAVTEHVRELESRLAELRSTANVLARLAGEPAPYPELVA